MALLKALRYAVYARASRYISRALLVEGTLRGTGQALRCLFVDNSPFTEYLLHRMYEGSVRTIRQWKLWIPALKRLVQPPLKEADLCIAVLPSGYEPGLRGLYAFKGRDYVRQVIDTSGPWEEIKKRFSRNKRNVANTLTTRYGLGYRISTEGRDFDLFYHRMHLPHVQRKFGALSDIDGYEDMRQYFQKGFLLLVERLGLPVAGALCMVEDRTLVARRAGVLDGDESHVRAGAQMALYYFRLRYANEQGLQTVDMMKSRSFLNDGVYITKREWGAAVCPDDESDNWVCYFLSRGSKGAALFFKGNPAIIHTERGLMGVVGACGPDGASTDETGHEAMEILKKKFHAPGIRGVLRLYPASGTFTEIPFV